MPPLLIENSNSSSSSSSSSSLATEEDQKIGAKDGKMSDEAMEGDGYPKDSIPHAVPISDSDSSDSDLDSRSFSEDDENDDPQEERKANTTSQLPPRDEAFEQDVGNESDSDSSDSEYDADGDFYDFNIETDDDIDAFLQDCSNTTTTTTTTTTTPQHHQHQEQEYQQQHHPPQHELQSQQQLQHRPHYRRLRQHYRQDSPHHYRRQPYLDTIAERKVSFAGRVVRMGGSQRYIFVDAVRVKAIPHKEDLPKKKIWYTPEEMKAIRKSCESRAAIVARHHTELYCRIAFRGLEPFIEPLIRELKEQQQQQQHSSETNTVVWSRRHALPRSSLSVVRNRAEPTTTRSEDDDPDSLFSYGHRHWDAIQAVLHEQAKQRWANAFVTRANQHEERSLERIRDAYKAVTTDSAAVALATASLDEIHARELDAGDGGMGRGSNDSCYYHDDDDDDDLPPKKKQQQPPCPNNNAWSSLVLSALARALVAPLLDSLVEVREGDIYVRVE